MKHRIQIVTWAAATLMAGLLAGCGMFTPKPDRSQFFVLTAVPSKDAPNPPPAPDAAIGVFAPEIASYLDRPQMVARLNENQISLNEFQRWAEPLGSSFSQVLAQDLIVLSGSNKVALFPLNGTFGQEFELYTKIFQFDGTMGGEVKLRVLWRLTGPNGRPNYVVKESVYTATAAGTPNPYTGYADALSGLVADFAKEIVAAVPQARAALVAKKAADEKAAAEAKLLQQATQAPPPTQTGTTVPPMVVPGAP